MSIKIAIVGLITAMVIAGLSFYNYSWHLGQIGKSINQTNQTVSQNQFQKPQLIFGNPLQFVTSSPLSLRTNTISETISKIVPKIISPSANNLDKSFNSFGNKISQNKSQDISQNNQNNFQDNSEYYKKFLDVATRVNFTADEFKEMKKDANLGNGAMLLGDLVNNVKTGNINDFKLSFLAWHNYNDRLIGELKKISTSYSFHQNLLDWFQFNSNVAKKFAGGNLSQDEINNAVDEFNNRAATQSKMFEQEAAGLKKSNWSIVPQAQAFTCGALVPSPFYHFGSRVVAPLHACVAPPVGIVITITPPCGGLIMISYPILAAMAVKGFNKPTPGSLILGKSTVAPGSCLGGGVSPPTFPWEATALFYGTSKLP